MLSLLPLFSLHPFSTLFKHPSILLPSRFNCSYHLSIAQWYSPIYPVSIDTMFTDVCCSSFDHILSDILSCRFFSSTTLDIVPYNSEYVSISLGINDSSSLLVEASSIACSLLKPPIISPSVEQSLNPHVLGYVSRSLSSGISPHITLGFLFSSDSDGINLVSSCSLNFT